ncbi:DUF4878 domain-containing protein [Kingella sp. SNUBH-2017]|jgi:hypothetical protein|uniref:DUF4878 domain-containing protein n=1 Tax=Kingella pumchi TaxID=2779506 RepID=A0ABS9NJY3_9NEIS|nr:MULTISPECIES: DUF4878 domain-containing protein [Kingella]MCG6502985.1 DUF4878 domain-containing protein [Kingella pumchi]MDD2183275.1 DUF4878 domain-containing protein [Kingella sp. SNUBH-2017]
MMNTRIKTATRFFAAAALGLLLAACSGASSSPENAAKAFVEKSYAGDADAVMAMVYIDEKDKKDAGVEDMVRGKIKSAVAKQKEFAEQHGGIDEITAQEAERNPANEKKARVAVEVKFKEGETRRENVPVIETDSGWKIDLM